MRHSSIFIACLIEPRAIDYIIILLLLVIEFAYTHRAQFDSQSEAEHAIVPECGWYIFMYLFFSYTFFSSCLHIWIKPLIFSSRLTNKRNKQPNETRANRALGANSIQYYYLFMDCVVWCAARCPLHISIELVETSVSTILWFQNVFIASHLIAVQSCWARVHTRSSHVDF